MKIIDSVIAWFKRKKEIDYDQRMPSIQTRIRLLTPEIELKSWVSYWNSSSIPRVFIPYTTEAKWVHDCIRKLDHCIPLEGCNGLTFTISMHTFRNPISVASHDFLIQRQGTNQFDAFFSYKFNEELKLGRRDINLKQLTVSDEGSPLKNWRNHHQLEASDGQVLYRFHKAVELIKHAYNSKCRWELKYET